MKAWQGLVILGLIAVLVFVLVTPTQVYALGVTVGFDLHWNLIVTPSISTMSIPRMTLLQTYSIGPAQPLALDFNLFNIIQFILQLNVTGTNSKGTVFFDGKFTFNTLAQERVQVYRQYDAALRSQNFTLIVDAYLFVDFADTTTPDIELTKSFGPWELTFPQ